MEQTARSSRQRARRRRTREAIAAAWRRSLLHTRHRPQGRGRQRSGCDKPAESVAIGNGKWRGTTAAARERTGDPRGENGSPVRDSAEPSRQRQQTEAEERHGRRFWNRGRLLNHDLTGGGVDGDRDREVRGWTVVLRV